jgi:hypothetical protein
MKGLSSLERVILECVGSRPLSYEEIQRQTGLQENVCFNLLQALLIKGLLRAQAGQYRISGDIAPETMEELNGTEARRAESLELIEAVLEQDAEKVFRFLKVALDPRDEKIFLAMLSNLESFLKDAHKRAQASVPLKHRKVVFWGVGEVETLMKQIMIGG